MLYDAVVCCRCLLIGVVCSCRCLLWCDAACGLQIFALFVFVVPVCYCCLLCAVCCSLFVVYAVCGCDC